MRRLQREHWFTFRITLTVLLASMLLAGRLPMAGAQEEGAADEGEATVTTAGAEPTEAPTEEPTEAAPTEAPSTEPPVQESVQEPVEKTEQKNVDTTTSTSSTKTSTAGTTSSTDSGVSIMSHTGPTPVTGQGGQYSVTWKAANPNLYDKRKPSMQACPGQGRRSSPFAGAKYGTALTSLAPPTLDLGQIVVFEVLVDAKSGAPADNGVKFVGEWATTTSSNRAFGYDASHHVYCAFVDTSDPANTAANAAVESVSSVAAPANTFRGRIHVDHLNPNDKAVVQVWVVLQDTVPDDANGNVHSALAGATADDDDDTINTGNQTVPILRIQDFLVPELTVTKVARNAADTQNITTVPHGGSFLYRVQVTNTGLKDATSVVMTDTVPVGLTVGTITTPPAGCSVSGRTVTCNLGTLTPGSTRTIDIPVVATSGTCGLLTNTAGATATGGFSDNSDPVDVTVLCAPALDLTKSAVDGNGDPVTSVAPNGSFFYRFVVSNTGTAASGPVT
ncbi:MAG TPA: hypothetical protein VM307_13610, partial [Egibacteraceae bacterium]|nr:hypothetical protein [Egibacteraceae bacterium]